MGILKFLKFLKYKISNKRMVDRVAAFDVEEECVTDKFKFSWEDIQRFTMNLSLVIGYGGFSTVYLAHLDKSSTTPAAAAVKIQCSSERLNQAYKQELEILIHLHHPNIVKLLGYCDDREEGILILEYVSKGNLQEKLHGSNNSAILSWKRRMTIAFQLAQAIEYIHNKCSLQIVHGDIKASNVLLDENLNCKLCDFGSAKMGFSSTVLPPYSTTNGRKRMMMMMTGSPGYTDPHYLRTGLASKKNDVYSFGVIVLELITGMEAFNPQSGVLLATRAGPMLQDVNKVVEMADPRLRGDFDLEEAKAMASLSAMCLSDSSSLRPDASDILVIMRKQISSSSFLLDKKFIQNSDFLCEQFLNISAVSR